MIDLKAALGTAVMAADPALAKRLYTDPTAYLDLVVLTSQAHDETRTMLASAVRSARTAGHSWEAVGRVLGMSRQAAQQRFGEAGDDTVHDGPAVKRLRPLTTFNEMGELRRAGRHGWHSVGYGPLFHTVEQSPYQWEHVRLFVHSPRIRRLEREGWERVGDDWFPWAYYKRRLGTPALPD